MRTGKDYIESLRESRKVIVGGELVERRAPGVRGRRMTIAKVYDFVAGPAAR